MGEGEAASDYPSGMTLHYWRVLKGQCGLPHKKQPRRQFFSTIWWQSWYGQLIRTRVIEQLKIFRNWLLVWFHEVGRTDPTGYIDPQILYTSLQARSADLPASPAGRLGRFAPSGFALCARILLASLTRARAFCASRSRKFSKKIVCLNRLKIICNA